MKKLALLLAAMTAVSAMASAKEVVVAPINAVEAPAMTALTAEQEFAIYGKVKENYKGFRATDFGMELEVESYSSDSNNGVSAYATAGFAYGDDITIELAAATFNDYNSNASGRDFTSGDSRAQLSIWKELNSIEGYEHAVGTRWRSQSSFERLYARYRYSTDMVSGWVDGAYTWDNERAGDTFFVETMPLVLNYNDFGLGYYLYAEKGNTTSYSNVEHQLRAYTPSYNFTDKFSVNAEYRLGLGMKTKDEDGARIYGYATDSKAGDVHMLYLNWSYDYSESLNLFAYTGIEYGKWTLAEAEDDTVKSRRDYRAYSDIGAGFTYSF